MYFFSTGVDTVDQVGQLNITGNIRPAIWNKTIVNEKGKPQRLAMDILADIVYWYRPTEVRDEASGQVVGWKKKFRADMLQRGYAEMEELFGEDRQAIKRALVFLEELGVVNRVLRTLKYKNGTISNNVMFLKLNVDVLYKLTYPEELEGNSNPVENANPDDYEIVENVDSGDNVDNFTPVFKNEQRVCSNMNGGYVQIQTEGVFKNEQRVCSEMNGGSNQIQTEAQFRNEQTNTKNTTENNYAENTTNNTKENTTGSNIPSNLISEEMPDLHIDMSDEYDYDELDDAYDIVGQNNGIPLEYAFRPDKMRLAILSLCNLRNKIYYYEKRGYKSEEDIVFESMVKNLLEMATSREMTVIGGTKKISYKHINDKLNRLLKKHMSLEGFLDRCVERYLDASRKTDIKKIDQYCKAIICNTIDIYEIDEKSAFNKSYSDGVRNNWWRD